MYQQMLFDLDALQNIDKIDNKFKKQKKLSKQQYRTSKQILDQNMESIVQYLQEEDRSALKLTCQSFYYYFITAQIWQGLKLNVADRKLQDYYDNYEFEQTQPKNITKKDKNIRIHSLKKNTLAYNNMNTSTNNNININSINNINNNQVTKNIIIKKRQASNIKQKRKAIMANNQLLMRNTQIGFKRLLHNNNTTKNIKSNLKSTNNNNSNINNGHNYKLSSTMQKQQQNYQLSAITHNLQLPTDISDYLINTKDPWSVNMHRTQNLITLIKKWNSFHHQTILSAIKKNHNSLLELINSLNSINQNIQYYSTKFTVDPQYQLIVNSISGAHNNLLIDDQLNKVSRLFFSYHQQTTKLGQQIQPFCKIFNEENVRKNLIKIAKSKQKEQQDAVKYVEMFGALEQIIDTCVIACGKYSTLGRLIYPILMSILYNIYQQKQQTIIVQIQQQNKPLLQQYTNTTNTKQTSLNELSYQQIVLAPNYFQILLQIGISIINKLLKLNQQNNNIQKQKQKQKQFMISLVLNKLKNTKIILQGLWNISKYFNKLLKQINSKNSNNKKDTNKIQAILSFFSLYYEDTKLLYTIKNVNKIEKQLARFKEQIGMLKDKMGTN